MHGFESQASFLKEKRQMRATPSMGGTELWPGVAMGRGDKLPKAGAGRQDTWQVFPNFRGLSLGDWQNLILCDYISSQLNQINFASKPF